MGEEGEGGLMQKKRRRSKEEINLIHTSVTYAC